MKRLHVHVSVEDVPRSVRFYRELFGAEPDVSKPDYDRAELAEMFARLQRAEGPVIEEGATTCCYARSEKSWINYPQGIEWETFLTAGDSTVYGTDVITPKAGKPCCTPGRAA